MMSTLGPDQNDDVDSDFYFMSSPQGSPESCSILLPPCKICADRSSGIHYGVNTCEACKGFFRRSFARKRKYKCKGRGGECILRPGRNNCAYCRYQRCLQAGMSKDAIKIGRYSYEEKTRHIQEAKTYLQNAHEKKFSSTTSNDFDSELFDSGYSNSPFIYSSNGSPEPPFVFDTIDTPSYQYKLSTAESPYQRLSPAHRFRRSSSPVTEDEFIYDEGDLGWEKETGGSKKRHTSAEDSVLDDVISEILTAHFQYNSSEGFLENQSEVHRRQLELYESIPHGSKDSSVRLQEKNSENETLMEERTFSTFDKLARNMVYFAKSIPGFTNLLREDQSTLIKGAFFEYFFLGYYRGMNADLGLFLFPPDSTINLQDSDKGVNREYLERNLEFSRCLKRLDLCTEEIALLRAISITSADRESLVEREKVESMQWLLVRCLRYFLRNHRTDHERFFTKVIDCLTNLRELTELDLWYTQNILINSSYMKTYPMLLTLNNGNERG